MSNVQAFRSSCVPDEMLLHTLILSPCLRWKNRKTNIVPRIFRPSAIPSFFSHDPANSTCFCSILLSDDLPSVDLRVDRRKNPRRRIGHRSIDGSGSRVMQYYEGQSFRARGGTPGGQFKWILVRLSRWTVGCNNLSRPVAHSAFEVRCRSSGIVAARQKFNRQWESTRYIHKSESTRRRPLRGSTRYTRDVPMCMYAGGLSRSPIQFSCSLRPMTYPIPETGVQAKLRPTEAGQA